MTLPEFDDPTGLHTPANPDRYRHKAPAASLGFPMTEEDRISIRAACRSALIFMRSYGLPPQITQTHTTNTHDPD